MKNVISKVEVQKRDKNRVNVYINEEFAFACNMELVYTYDLKKGKEVDLESIEKVVKEDNYLKGKDYALRIIEKTYKTEKQIRDKLYKKEYGDTEVERIIDFLKQYKFIDDYRYMKMFINDNIKKYGKNKIKYDLIKRGVEEELINKQLDDISYEVQYNIAYDLAITKYKCLIKLDKDPKKNINKIYKKLGDFLIRRGYDFQIVNQVINNLKNSSEKEELNEEDKYIEEEQKQEKTKLVELALKRYAVISKSESDYIKIYRRLASYLMRRGYSYEEVSKVLKDILKNENI